MGFKKLLVWVLLCAAVGSVYAQTDDDSVDAVPMADEDDIGDNNRWCDRQFYLAGSFCWTPRIYYDGTDTSHYTLNWGFGLDAEYHFAHLATVERRAAHYFSVETGLEFAPDWIRAVVPGKDDAYYRDFIMTIPLALKIVLKPAQVFMLEPYLGTHFNISLQKTTHPFPASFRIGSQLGVKVGSGVLFLDPRFSVDFGDSTVVTKSGTQSYKRYILHIGLGYKYGFPAQRRE